ncbi:hypothetical protein [Alkalihalobacillus pseudalcaliphilus]|uniref:hypothetical protein n=1 Tax=Alkalihalobacillus pseudalcaliphilus TaxID=79884 RepID=UPI00064D9FF3|nr:hypothetical protein [Alkalihalobacillus pseudalcaliphilus]KMK76149.1 hypothetical protein AB990_13070 [Alkalihalobacillus pseudalcaliphilus]
MKTKSRCIGFFVLLLLLSACSNGDSPTVQSLLVDHKQFEQTEANESKKKLMELDEFIDVHGVSIEDRIYLSPKVKQLARFRLNGLRKQSFDQIKNLYPEHEIHVSTDKKVYMELEKLEQRLKDGKITEEELKKELDKIEKHMKG